MMKLAQTRWELEYTMEPLSLNRQAVDAQPHNIHTRDVRGVTWARDFLLDDHHSFARRNSVRDTALFGVDY